MAIQINGTDVIDNDRKLKNLSSLGIPRFSSAPSGASSGDLYQLTTDDSVYCFRNSTWELISQPPINLFSDFAPADLASPAEILSGSGTWSIGSRTPQTAILFMVTSGASGNTSIYQSNWGFRGSGSIARFIFTDTTAMYGMTYNTATVPHNNWQAQEQSVCGTSTSIVLNGTTYTPNGSSTGTRDISAGYIPGETSGLTRSNQGILCNAGQLTISGSMSAPNFGGASSAAGPNSYDYAGAGGAGSYPSYAGGPSTSLYSGDGGDVDQYGQLHGGGGGGSNVTLSGRPLSTGGLGTIRIYYPEQWL
tara:strand:- start:2967 stop:3884 length:918 start_codon:yes stop_codon:yes gene_type:complete